MENNCERCLEAPAVALVTSEILKMKVCGPCALAAMDFMGDQPDQLRVFGCISEETGA